MTPERKLLTLLDRGIVHVSDAVALLGAPAKRTSKALYRDGLVSFTDGSKAAYMTITPKGVERLNELDGMIG